MHKKLSVGNLFSFNQIHVITKGLFTCPAKSFFLFAHNQPINDLDMISHPVVNLLKDIKTKSELYDKINSQDVNSEQILPKTIDYSSQFGVDLVEFNH